MSLLRRTPRHLLLVSGWLLSAGAAPAQGRFEDLGALPGHNASSACAVSADGGTVVGWSSVGVAARAIRWTEASGMQDLGPGFARGVSANGDVVVGGMGGLFDLRAFRWTAAQGALDLGTLGGPQSEAWAVNADGSVVVGSSADATGASRAFLWTAANGMRDIGPGAALGVSADGSVVVGSTPDSSVSGNTAFRWSSGTGRQLLLPGSVSSAYAISADGETVVGVEYRHSTPTHLEEYAFRWTSISGWQLIDPGRQSYATGVNADGSVVAVTRSNAASSGWVAARWTVSRGVLELAMQSPSSSASTTNSDGSIVVGRAQYAFRWFSSGIGERFCTAEPNSTGRGALLDANGSDLVALDDVRLSAEFLPLSSFAYFLVSRDIGLTYPLSNSQGRLCLGGSIGRYVGPGQVQGSGMTGRIELALDLGAVPTPLGPVAAHPGDTWRFQAWYRDANPAATSNLTDSIGVTLN